jgi:hypothetical protein
MGAREGGWWGNVADVIDHDGLEAVQPGDELRALEVALGGQQLLDHFEGRHEQDVELVPPDPPAAERGDEVGLAPAGEAKAK